MAVKSNWISAWFQNETHSSRNEFNSNKMILENKKSEEEWLRKYAPKTPSDLIIHKNKQDIINAWLQGIKGLCIGSSPILIMSGPSGCGKTTALKVLAKFHNFEILEWITPLDIENYERGPGSYMQSQSSKFEEFLVSAGRYVSVFDHDKGVNKLILVKDIPNVFLIQPGLLQGILRHYCTVGRNPVVFILPEQMEGINSMFPKSFIEELNIQQINFNKISNSAIVKVLKRIHSLNKEIAVLSANDLDKLVEDCNGDVRNVILQLYYQSKEYLSDNKNISVVIKQKLNKGKTDYKRKTQGETKQSQSSGVDGKDIHIPIFQRIGRLLYPKKSSIDREELKHDPEEIVEQTISQPRQFLNMVHENYLKIYRDMDAVCRAIKYSSDSDAMVSEFNQKDLTLPMALSTITRGFMTCSSSANRKWTPLTNQENALFRKKTQLLRDIITSIDSKYVLIPRDASMDILPIICPEFSIRKSTYIRLDSELCSSSDEEEASTSDRSKKLRTYTTISAFCDKRSKLNERGLTDEDKRLDSYDIEEIQSDTEVEQNGNDDWVDEDFLENFDF